MPPLDATEFGAGVAALGSTAEGMEACGSAIGVLEGTMELGNPPVDAAPAGFEIGVEEATIRGAFEARESTAGVLAGTIELGSPPAEATAAGLVVGVGVASDPGRTEETIERRADATGLDATGSDAG